MKKSVVQAIHGVVQPSTVTHPKMGAPFAARTMWKYKGFETGMASEDILASIIKIKATLIAVSFRLIS